jgi:peptidoglycan hydrolase CwlO-like protein
MRRPAATVSNERRPRVEVKTSKAGQLRPRSDTTEALIAELTDEVEHLRDELTRMRWHASTLEAERERLESELAQANQWVKLLAEEIETTTARLSAEARPLGARIARTD